MELSAKRIGFVSPLRSMSVIHIPSIISDRYLSSCVQCLLAKIKYLNATAPSGRTRWFHYAQISYVTSVCAWTKPASLEILR